MRSRRSRSTDVASSSGRGPRNMRKDLEELERPPQQAVGVELVWLPSSGGAETLIAPISNFGRPHFVNGDTARVYFSEGSTLVSMRWDGTDQKTILRTGGGGGRGGGGGGGGEMIDVARRQQSADPGERSGGPARVRHSGNSKDRQRADDQRDESGAVGGSGSQADDGGRRVLDAGRRTASTSTTRSATRSSRTISPRRKPRCAIR